MVVELTQEDNDILLKYIQEFNKTKRELSDKISMDCFIESIEFGEVIRFNCIGINLILAEDCGKLNTPKNLPDIGERYSMDLINLDSDVKLIVIPFLRDIKLSKFIEI